MLVGGTGVTPMIQALHALLGTEGDTTKVTMLYGNRSQKDILAKLTLDLWSSKFSHRFSVEHILSRNGVTRTILSLTNERVLGYFDDHRHYFVLTRTSKALGSLSVELRSH